MQYVAKVWIYCIYMYFLQEKIISTQNVLEIVLAEDYLLIDATFED